MIKLTSEYLSFQLAKELRSCYFLVGNDSFLLQESEQIVLEAAQKKDFRSITVLLVIIIISDGKILF